MKNKINIITLLITVFILSISHYSMARAGGGWSDSGSWILQIILFPFALVYVIILNSKLKKKSKKVKELTEQLAKEDAIWNYRNLMSTSRIAFMRVQKAWMERNQDLVKDIMTQKIYNKHKSQTDEMIANETKNILEDIKISEIVIVSISDYKDDSKDSFSAYISASMIDYIVDLKTSKVISGDNSDSNSFSEIWTFLREDDKWKLEEINKNASFKYIDNSKVFSE